MDKLPQELIDRIVWFAERYPGQERYFSTIEQSPTLQSIVTGNRRNYLSWISLEPGLPTYSDEVYKHKESRLDRHTNNETFTITISDLFGAL